MPMFGHLYEIIQRRAERWPLQVAVGGQAGLTWRTLTGYQLRDQVDRLAAELAALGVGNGDRVVLWLPNGWRTPVYYFALWKLGAVAVPFDQAMNPTAAAAILGALEARLVVTGYGEQPSWAAGQPLLEWWEPGRRGGHPTVADTWQRPAEELALLSFTSGTTGQPKGCMITHANLCFEVEALPALIPLDERCRLASILPLSHLFELTCGLLYPLAEGAAVHYVPSRRAPDIIGVLRSQRVTHMVVVPQVLQLMGQAIERELRQRLSPPLVGLLLTLAARLPLAIRRRLWWTVHRRLGGQLRLLASGGAPLAAATQRLWERLGVRVVQGYGASETAPVVAGGRADGRTPLGSVGQPLPGVEVRLTREGELLVRGPNVMRGYWREPQRTAAVLRDGWYATGDSATIDAQGNLTIVGRLGELIILPSGLKVWPHDVEAVLTDQPGIRAAAIVPVPSAAGGMTLHAYLIPADSAEPRPDLRQIIAAANGLLAQHQRVVTAAWWSGDDFPRTAIGKIRRHLLPPPAAEAVAIAAAQASDDPVGQAIRRVAGRVELPAEQTLGQLGLDSLALVDLTLALEETTGTTVADGTLRQEMTVGQVRALMLAAGPAGPAGGRSRRAEVPDWPYTGGGRLRWLRWPIDLLYAAAVTRTTVLGSEALTGLAVPTIFAGTHRSFPDVALVRHALWRSPARPLVNRLIVPTLASGILRYRVYGWWSILALGLYPVDDLGVGSDSLRRLVHLAERGNAILIFPQGRHTTLAREVAGTPEASFRHGAAQLAMALGAPVVPFGLAGSEQLVPPDLSTFRGPVVAGIPLALHRGPLAIAFGPALRVTTGESVVDFTARLQVTCLALAQQAAAALGQATPTGATAHGHEVGR